MKTFPRLCVSLRIHLRSIEINLFGKQLRKFVYRKNLILTFFVPSNTDIHRVKEAPTSREAKIILHDDSNIIKNEQLHLTSIYHEFKSHEASKIISKFSYI